MAKTLTVEDRVKVESLNALMDPGNRWECWRAKHDHIDAFGQEVKMDQYHWFRRSGGSFHEVTRLSLESMRKFLMILLEDNLNLQTELKQRAEKRQRDLLDEVGSLLPRLNQD
ncbi:hypothetical protein P0Y35_08610 [Kiritimatiellaeota bacterium B1221]|nr:hypothetical protein [Kiritimatiellaeota bacterium B1221]